MIEEPIQMKLPKWLRILDCIRDNDSLQRPNLYISQLMKLTGTNHSYTRKVVKSLEMKGYVTLEKTGKCRIVALTAEGRKPRFDYF